MSTELDKVVIDALKLSPIERVELIEKLLASFSFPDKKPIDELWTVEAEKRIDAYERGEIKSRPASEVFRRISLGEI